jgi:sphinganine-1-phosphate aldolase
MRQKRLLAVIKTRLFRYVRRLPSVRKEIEQKQAAVKEDIKRSVLSDVEKEKRIVSLPEQGVSERELIGTLQTWSETETKRWMNGKVSGAVYHGGTELSLLQGKVLTSFGLSNPLHPDIFPFVRKMEAEVIAMVLNLFHAPEGSGGSFTSGGTESIILAVKSHRDWARYEKGITEPEMIVPVTAHAAFNKASQLLGVRIIPIEVDPKSFRVHVSDVKRAISSNTIMIVGSAPNYPQGTIDPLEALGRLAKRKGIGLHSDCCLGSFLLVFAEQNGVKLPVYDFRAEGVTSVSADTHKYGFCPKGSSIVMYRTEELRRYQYFAVPEWTGGIYATPTISGSRPGSLSAAAWATMLYIGQEGYRQAAKDIMDTAHSIREGVRKIVDLVVLGEPDAELSVIAFASKHSDLNIYAVADCMKEKGWSLNTLQHPASLHICVTFLQKDMSETFLSDLRESVEKVKRSPEAYSRGSAAIYGMASNIPDASLLEDAATLYLDVLYTA